MKPLLFFKHQLWFCANCNFTLNFFLQEETPLDEQTKRDSMSLQASPAVGYPGQESYGTYGGGGGNQLHPGDTSYEFEVRTLLSFSRSHRIRSLSMLGQIGSILMIVELCHFLLI